MAIFGIFDLSGIQWIALISTALILGFSKTGVNGTFMLSVTIIASRVNRVFRDKPHGLVVDYIGIGDDLRKATDKYTSGGGRGNPAPEVSQEALPVFISCVETIRKPMPEGRNYGGWRRMSRIEMEDLYSLVYGHLAEDDDLRGTFLEAELRLSSAFLLVKHMDEGRVYADELIFYQRVRKQFAKALPGKKAQRDLERAVRDLVDDAVESEGVVDIFKAAGIEEADLSILDDKFLQTFKDRPQLNLRLKLLEQLLRDEIHLRQGKNVAKMRSFSEMLDATLKKYHNRLIDVAAVVKAMIDIKRDMDSDQQRAAELNLEPEELAFYDAVAVNAAKIYDQAFLRNLIHDVVQAIKRNLKADWTESHREDVKAEIRAAVKRVLRNRDVRVEDFEPFLERLMAQAAAMYANWPSAA